MAEGLGSLAGGFMAGFQMMDGYYRGQKADARADKEMSLREAQAQRDADYKQWTMDRTVERDKVGDQQWKETFTETQKNNADTRKRQWAQLSLQEKQESRLASQARLQQESAERTRYQSEHAAVFAQVYRKLDAGEALTEQEMKIVRNPLAGRYNIDKYADPRAEQAGKTLLGAVNQITQLGASGELDKMDPVDVHASINTPEVLNAANMVFGDDARKVVGNIDPASGRVIEDAKVAGFTPLPPTEDGVPRFAIELELVDEDGNSLGRRPVTGNRSTDPDDKVRGFTIPEFTQHVGAYTSLSHLAGGQLRQDLGFTEGPDTKGLRTASVDLQKQMTRDLAAIDKAVAREDMTPEQGRDAKAGITETYGQQQQGLRDTFNPGNQGGGHPSGGQPSGGKVKAYIKDLGSKNPRLAELLPMAAQSQDLAVQQQYRAALAADDDGAMYNVLMLMAKQADALQESQATEQLQAILQREGGQAPSQEEAPQRRVNRSSFIPGGIPGLSSLAQ